MSVSSTRGRVAVIAVLLCVGLVAPAVASADPASDAHERKVAAVRAEPGYAEPLPEGPEPGSPEANRQVAIFECNEHLGRLVDALGKQVTAGTVCTDPLAKKATLYVAGGAAAADKLRPSVVSDAQRDGFTLTVIGVTRSTAQLEALCLNISTTWSDEAQRVISPHMNSCATNIETNGLTLGVLPEQVGFWTDEQASQLLGVPVNRELNEPATVMNRYTDQAPHWGGARILMYEPGSDPNDIYHPGAFSGACTSGFAATNEGYSVMVTAGHCAPVEGTTTIPTWIWGGHAPGTEPDGFSCNYASACPAAGGWFGSVWKTGARFYSNLDAAHKNPSQDVALTRGESYEPWYWSNGSTTANASMQSYAGPGASYAGLNVCISGATTKGSCGWTGVSHATQDISDGNDHYMSAMVWMFTRSDRNGCVAGGDSGGTVTWLNPNNAKRHAVGVLSAASACSSAGQTVLVATWADARTFYPTLTPTITG